MEGLLAAYDRATLLHAPSVGGSVPGGLDSRLLRQLGCKQPARCARCGKLHLPMIAAHRGLQPLLSGEIQALSTGSLAGDDLSESGRKLRSSRRYIPEKRVRRRQSR